MTFTDFVVPSLNSSCENKGLKSCGKVCAETIELCPINKIEINERANASTSSETTIGIL